MPLLLPRPRPAALVASVLLFAACDASGPAGYAVEVSPLGEVRTADGERALRFTVRNAGTEPLASVVVQVQTPPIEDASVGTRVEAVDPGQTATADVALIHLPASGEYACYRTEVVAFAPERREALVVQDGPETCRAGRRGGAP